MNDKSETKEVSNSNNPEIIEDLESCKSRVVVSSQVQSGPLPTAEEFARYAQVDETASKRILDYAEKEQSHRQKNDTAMTRATISEVKRGQYLAFSLMLFLILASIFIVLNGAPLLGGIIGVVAAVSGLANKLIDGRFKSAPKRPE